MYTPEGISLFFFFLLVLLYMWAIGMVTRIANWCPGLPTPRRVIAMQYRGTMPCVGPTFAPYPDCIVGLGGGLDG